MHRKSSLFFFRPFRVQEEGEEEEVLACSLPYTRCLLFYCQGDWGLAGV
jgi:hypothetical protein